MVSSGIHGGYWSGEEYLYIAEIRPDAQTSFTKTLYLVYPAVTAETEEEALKKAEMIADGDGEVIDVRVSRIADDLWMVVWEVLD